MLLAKLHIIHQNDQINQTTTKYRWHCTETITRNTTVNISLI